MAELEVLSVTVRTRDGAVFQGPATSVTSVNKDGKFDILPGHANFISLVDKSIIVNQPDGTVQEFEVTNGSMKVLNNQVTVLLGIKKDEAEEGKEGVAGE